MCSDVLTTAADLVRINSVNPAFEHGRPEAELINYVRRFFQERGLETWEQEVGTARANLIARLPGRDPSRRIVLDAHCDTASVTGMTIAPFEPEVIGGRLYGRGACDTKAGLASMMHALADIKKSGRIPRCEVWLVAVADEEFGFTGVMQYTNGLQAAAAVVAEPTDMRLVVAAKGCLRWRIWTLGQAAHSSKPQLGINAIEKMAHVILAVQEHTSKLSDRCHPLLGSPTCNVGVIQGGLQVNFVPDGCYIDLERRLIPGEQPSDVLAEYDCLLARLAEQLPQLKCRMDAPRFSIPPMETPADSPVVACAAQVLTENNLDAEPIGAPFGCDGNVLSGHGIPTIVLGPGNIDQAHAAVEFVDCAQVEQAVDIYRDIILKFDG